MISKCTELDKSHLESLKLNYEKALNEKNLTIQELHNQIKAMYEHEEN